jgi:hypothetical protein
MNIHKALTFSAIAVVLAIPGFVSATSLWHDAGGEAGSTFHPDHVKSTKTRADVLQELEAARKDGSLWYLQRGLPVPVKNAGPGRTREEVRNEVLNLTAEERRQLQMIGGR